MNHGFALLIAIAALAGLPCHCAFADKVHIGASWTSQQMHPDEIRVGPFREDGSALPQALIDINASQGIKNPKLFQLIKDKDGKKESIEITQVEARQVPTNPANRVARIILVLKKPPVDDARYTLTIPSGALVLDVPAGLALVDADKPIAVSGTPEEHNKYAHPFPENKLSLQQTGETGTVSFQYYHNYVFSSGPNLFDVHLALNADASLLSALSNKYIDKVEAEAGGYLVRIVGMEREVLGQRGIIEAGFSSKLQADQQFDKIDSTIGVNAWFWLNNDLFGEIYRRFCLFGTKPDFGLPPTIILGYDYVGHLKDDGSAHGFSGNNRLTGRFSWTLPVGRELHSDVLILNQIKEIDFVSDVSGTYDVENAKAAPLISLSIDFILSTSNKLPSVSFSYADGKAAPKFQQFDAFLAGFKMHF
jgi:hypothetical protein